MSATERESGAPAEMPQLELLCREVWGGNLPVAAPFALPGLSGFVYSQPSDGGRGGDIHCLSICGSGVIARLGLADVVGHGEEVDAVANELHELMRRNMNAFDNRSILRKLNQRLVRAGLSKVTTVALATYFPPTGALTLSYAGHPPGWVYRRSERRWERVSLARPAANAVQAVDVPLAVEADARFSRRQVHVQEGDGVLLLTDGVLEAQSASDAYFDADRVQAVLDAAPDLAPRDMGQHLVGALKRFVGDRGLGHDDVSLIVAEVVEPTSGPLLWRMLRNRLFRPRGTSDLPAFRSGARPARRNPSD